MKKRIEDRPTESIPEPEGEEKPRHLLRHCVSGCIVLMATIFADSAITQHLVKKFISTNPMYVTNVVEVTRTNYTIHVTNAAKQFILWHDQTDTPIQGNGGNMMHLEFGVTDSGTVVWRIKK